MRTLIGSISQFRLITLFLLMILASIPLTYLGVQARQHRQFAAAQARIFELGGSIDVISDTIVGSWQRPGRRCVVISINLEDSSVGDSDLAVLASATFRRHSSLRDPFPVEGTDLEIELELGNTGISDAGLQHLHGMMDLVRVSLPGTRVTAAGIESLKAANARIEIVAR